MLYNTPQTEAQLGEADKTAFGYSGLAATRGHTAAFSVRFLLIFLGLDKAEIAMSYSYLKMFHLLLYDSPFTK